MSAAIARPDVRAVLEDAAMSEPARAVELLHRWSPRRVLVANVEAWSKACPRPAGFEATP